MKNFSIDTYWLCYHLPSAVGRQCLVYFGNTQRGRMNQTFFIYSPWEVPSDSLTNLCFCNLDYPRCLHKLGMRFTQAPLFSTQCWVSSLTTQPSGVAIPPAGTQTAPEPRSLYTECPLYISTWGLIKIN